MRSIISPMSPLCSPTRSMRTATGVVEPVRAPSPPTGSRLRGCAPRAATRRRPQRRLEQSRRHLERGDERRAAAQQHADRAVEARELVDAQALADRRNARDAHAADARRRARASARPRRPSSRDERSASARAVRLRAAWPQSISSARGTADRARAPRRCARSAAPRSRAGTASPARRRRCSSTG